MSTRLIIEVDGEQEPFDPMNPEHATALAMTEPLMPGATVIAIFLSGQPHEPISSELPAYVLVSDDGHLEIRAAVVGETEDGREVVCLDHPHIEARVRVSDGLVPQNTFTRIHEDSAFIRGFVQELRDRFTYKDEG